MWRHGTLIAAGILLLSACGGGAADDASTGSTSPTVSSSTSTTVAPSTPAPSDGDATLADYLPMFGPEDPEEAEAFWRNQERQAQEYTRECMAEEGFEYIPFVPGGEEFYGWGPEDEEERVKTQGFGMAWWFLEGEALMEEQEDEGGPDDDPNWAIGEAMSDAEREAYEWALYGEQPEADLDWESAETEEEMMALEEEAQRLWEAREWIGCMEFGWNQAQGGGEDLWRSFEDEFGDWWAEVDERVRADPRIIELEASWVTCMAEAGYEFRDMDEMHMSLEEEFERIMTWPEEGDSESGVTAAPPAVEPVEQEDGSVVLVDPEGNEYTEEQMEEFWRPQYDEAELRAFMEREIAIATADYYCGQGRWDSYGEIYEEYQNQWVAEHKAELDAWKAGREAGE
jgi:hypothetical protein